jgi:hypothetical protein
MERSNDIAFKSSFAAQPIHQHGRKRQGRLRRLFKTLGFSESSYRTHIEIIQIY